MSIQHRSIRTSFPVLLPCTLSNNFGRNAILRNHTRPANRISTHQARGIVHYNNQAYIESNQEIENPLREHEFVRYVEIKEMRYSIYVTSYMPLDDGGTPCAVIWDSKRLAIIIYRNAEPEKVLLGGFLHNCFAMSE